MERSLEEYGAGSGLAIGAGIGGTAAVLVSLESALALVAGIGVAGGLLIGALAGRYASAVAGRPGWTVRLSALTITTGLFAGGLSGVVVAWSVGTGWSNGLWAGSAAGALFGFVLAAILVAAVRKTPIE